MATNKVGEINFNVSSKLPLSGDIQINISCDWRPKTRLDLKRPQHEHVSVTLISGSAPHSRMVKLLTQAKNEIGTKFALQGNTLEEGSD